MRGMELTEARRVKFAAHAPFVTRERPNPERIWLRISLGFGRRRQLGDANIGRAAASSALSGQ